MIQKMIIDALHKEGKSQRVITERGGCASRVTMLRHLQEKGYQATSETETSSEKTQPSTRTFWSTSCFLLLTSFIYGDADFIFQQDLAPAHTAKDTKSWFNDHGVTVLDWWANSPDLNPIENLWCIVKRKIRDTRLDNADDLKAAIKATWASITPEQCHRLIASIALMQYFMQKEAQPSICGWSLWMEIIETNDVLLRIRFLLKNSLQLKRYWKFHTSVLLADHVKQCRSLCSSLPRPLAPPAGVISYHPNLI